jgi:hypothetical protein
LRAIVVATPVVLLASALYAAPKAKPSAKPPARVSADAATESGPRETKVTAPTPSDAAVGDAIAPDAAKPASKADHAATALSDGGVREGERKEGDASVKTFDFGSTEITGKARWPAVTYFTRRLRAEFDAQKLPHRSFFPELSATKGEGSAR